MTNPKTVKEVLEEYRDEIIDCGLQDGDCTCFKENTEKAQLQLDALYKAWYQGMQPKEKDITNGHSTDIAFGNGFNSAIQEMRGKITPRKEN